MKTAWIVFLIFILLLGYVFGYVYFSGVQKELLLERDFLESEISTQNADISKKNEMIFEYEKTVSDLGSSLEMEEGTNKSLREEVKSLRGVVSDLESRVMCENQISWNVDYSDAGIVNQSLIRWVEEVESVVNSDYKTLFSNSKTSWHEIRGSEHLYLYVVFYDDPEHDSRNAIYSVGCQAYVD